MYTGGKMFDLNSFIPANSGWTLQSATGINDNGEIVGDGVNPQGYGEAFLLTPDSPEPGSLGVIAGFALLALYDRPRRHSRASSFESMQ